MLSKLKNTVYLFVFASFFIHTIFYTGLDLFSNLNKVTPVQKINQPIEIKIVNSDKNKKMQIIEQDKLKLNEEIDKKARFLARHNQKVVRETRAEKTGKFSNTAQTGMRKKGSNTAKKKKSKQKMLTGKLPTLDKLKPQFSMAPKAENLTVDKVGMNSQTSDHLKDVNKGLQTLLSTREFVYYSYYQRIREKIRQQWEPRIRKKVKKVYASGRSIASARDRVTQVVIILNSEGNLETVKVVGQSGLHDLDDAAIEAFKAAEPFPNPPTGIEESDGKIRIRWDFVLEAKSLPKEHSQKRFAKREQP